MPPANEGLCTEGSPPSSRRACTVRPPPPGPSARLSLGCPGNTVLCLQRPQGPAPRPPRLSFLPPEWIPQSPEGHGGHGHVSRLSAPFFRFYFKTIGGDENRGGLWQSLLKTKVLESKLKCFKLKQLGEISNFKEKITKSKLL